MANIRTAECAECGRRLRLRKNGAIWNHNDKQRSAFSPEGQRCRGAGKPSRPGTARWADEET